MRYICLTVVRHFIPPVVLLALGLLNTHAALAEADGPDFFRVKNVSADDVLHVRRQPGADQTAIGSIPADGNGIRNLGCVGGLSLAEWKKATREQRETAGHTRWCRVRYKGIEGWAAGWYLAEGDAPADGTEPVSTFIWRLAASNAGPAVGDAWIRFSADGSVAGSTGCNGFHGTAVLGAGTASFPQPLAATKRFCPGPGTMAQEDAVFAALTAAARYEIDLVTGRLTITGPTGTDQLVYTAAER